MIDRKEIIFLSEWKCRTYFCINLHNCCSLTEMFYYLCYVQKNISLPMWRGIARNCTIYFPTWSSEVVKNWKFYSARVIRAFFFFWLNRLPSFTCTTSSSTHPTDWIDVHRIIIEIRLQLVCVRDDTATLWRGKINVYSHGRRMFNLLRENDEFNNLCAKVEYLWAFPSSLYTHMCDVQLNYHRTIQFIYPWGDFSSIFFFLR